MNFFSWFKGMSYGNHSIIDYQCIQVEHGNVFHVTNSKPPTIIHWTEIRMIFQANDFFFALLAWVFIFFYPFFAAFFKKGEKFMGNIQLLDGHMRCLVFTQEAAH